MYTYTNIFIYNQPVYIQSVAPRSRFSRSVGYIYIYIYIYI